MYFDIKLIYYLHHLIKCLRIKTKFVKTDEMRHLYPPRLELSTGLREIVMIICITDGQL